MKITGKRTFALSQMEKFELLVVRAALNEYYKLEINDQAVYDNPGVSPQGEVALRLLNQINHHLGA
jgi:hypothetical protein